MNWCPYCSTEFSKIDHGGSCPKVRAIDYYPNGSVKRVEFKCDEPATLPSSAIPIDVLRRYSSRKPLRTAQ